MISLYRQVTINFFTQTLCLTTDIDWDASFYFGKLEMLDHANLSCLAPFLPPCSLKIISIKLHGPGESNLDRQLSKRTKQLLLHDLSGVRF